MTPADLQPIILTAAGHADLAVRYAIGGLSYLVAAGLTPFLLLLAEGRR